MFKHCRWVTALLLAGACLAVWLPGQAEAQKRDTEPSEDEQKVADLNDLISAYKLIDYGRAKEAPEALITAAGMMRRLAKVKMSAITEKVTVESDKDAPKPDEADLNKKAPNLDDLANDLFDEAEALGAKQKVNVAPLIKSVKARPNTRAVVGGPRTTNRNIGARQTHTFNFEFFNQQPLAIGFRSSHPMRFQAMRHGPEQGWVDAMTTYGIHNGIPNGPRGGRARVEVRIHNPHNHPASFELFVN